MFTRFTWLNVREVSIVFNVYEVHSLVSHRVSSAYVIDITNISAAYGVKYYNLKRVVVHVSGYKA